MLRSRPVRLGLLGVVPQRVPAWQLLYRTRDREWTPEAAVTMVLLPAGADREPRPLVSFQCALDADAPQGFPSYALRLGARAPGAIPALELALIAAALARGWAVSVPDHGGQGAPREPGYRVLDAARAALSFAPLGLPPSTPVGLWGYACGGLATARAAAVAAEYAPELDVVGAVAAAPVRDPGGRAPVVPVLVVRGRHPGVIPVADVDPTGARVHYLRDRCGTHRALPVIAAWLADRFADRPPAPPETRTVWSVARVRGQLEFAALLVRMVLGRPLRATARLGDTMTEDPVEALRRWTDSGGTWQVIAGGAGAITVALLPCTGGDEVDRLVSDDPALRAYLDGRTSSADH